MIPDLDFLKTVTLLLAACVEGAAALVIGLAAIEAVFRVLLLFLPGPADADGTDLKELVRLRLGRYFHCRTARGNHSKQRPASRTGERDRGGHVAPLGQAAFAIARPAAQALL